MGRHKQPEIRDRILDACVDHALAHGLPDRLELFAETYAQDCPPDIARDAAALLVPQTLAVTQQPVRAAAWHDLPTTYVVCAEDRGTPAAAQREFSRRADTVIEVKAGHHPFLSQPQTVADIIASLS